MLTVECFSKQLFDCAPSRFLKTVFKIATHFNARLEWLFLATPGDYFWGRRKWRHDSRAYVQGTTLNSETHFCSHSDTLKICSFLCTVCLPSKATHRVHHCFHLRLSYISEFWMTISVTSQKRTQNFSRRLFYCEVTSLALFDSGFKSPNVAIYNQILFWSTVRNCFNSDETFEHQEQVHSPFTNDFAII